MIDKPMDILSQYPVRKSKKQKQAFRDAIYSYAQSLGYACAIEKGNMGAQNVVIGNPETAEHLITAHYDTCARMPFPNLITPCNFILYLLYQIAITVILLALACVLGIIVVIFTMDVNIALSAYWVSLMVFLLLMIYGPANKNNANDNTSGVVTLLEIAKSFPEEQRHKVCFVLFDLEEAGLIGSAAYHSKHKKESRNQLVWNLDCVGEGDDLIFFSSNKVKKDENKMLILQKCVAQLPSKQISVRKKGFSFYPSDQANFPYGVGIAALKRNKLCLYLDKIHTKRDTVLDETNVNILRAAIISAITCHGVQ